MIHTIAKFSKIVTLLLGRVTSARIGKQNIRAIFNFLYVSTIYLHLYIYILRRAPALVKFLEFIESPLGMHIYSEYEINNVAKSLSSSFSSSRQDRQKMNTDSESGLKTTLKNGLKYVEEIF